MASRESRAVVRDSAHKRSQSKEIEHPDLSSTSPLRILLLGKSVSENSRVGNLILGRSAFDSEAPPDVVERVGGRLKHRHVTLINSPQLLHTHLSDDQITQTVRECVSLSDPGPHVVLLLLQHQQCSAEDQERVEKLQDSFSERLLQHTLVLSTQEPTEPNQILQKIIQMCSNRHFSLQRSSSADHLLQAFEDIEKSNKGRHLISAAQYKDSMREQTEFNERLREERERMEREKEELQSKHEEELNRMKIQIEQLNREREELMTRHEEEKERMEMMMEEERQKQEKEKKRREEEFREREVRYKRLIKEREQKENELLEPMKLERMQRQKPEERLRREEKEEKQKSELHKRRQSPVSAQTSASETMRPKETVMKSQQPEHTLVSSLPSRWIVLLGKTGAGKRSAKNTILGQREFRSEMRVRPATSECSAAQATVSGRSVSVVDTPGFFHPFIDNEEVMMEISRSVYISSPGPHAFLIVFSVNMRFTEQELQIPQMMVKMFGEEVLKYSIILFTHGDLLEGWSVEEFIEKNNRVRSLVDQCGGRYQLLNNRDVNNREQVEDLLQKIDSMIEQNRGVHYSIQMYEDAQRFRREEEKRRPREEMERKPQEENKYKRRLRK
ncbi:GTPase IMAP family member 8-like [Danio aesculapii]|uniref:GTPase IMAP family member 8-like n=1 Tax=Danio aesculapii TaxID=1142201 RepID=UPI0024BF3B3A|nr:GTPase IMAP family member 8-like [Danio aesculapii]